jgi:peptide/nickel transport system permease protein
MALAEPLPSGEEQQAPATAEREVILGYPTLRSHILHKVRRETLPKIGLLIVFATIFLAIFGPLIAPYNTTAATNLVNAAPSAAHWFGTDGSGLDIFSRVIAAPRIDVSIALLATALALIVGSAIGLFATFYGGWLGALAIRATDTLQAFPALILAIIVVVLTGHGIGNIIVVIAVLNMPLYARLMRGEVLRIRDRAFVEAARASGLSDLAIAWRQVLPNATAPVVAQMSVTIGWAILATAGLSFLGAGVLPPTPEWGSMISTGSSGIILGQWWPSVFPGLAMALTVFGFAVVADTIQTALGREG